MQYASLNNGGILRLFSAFKGVGILIQNYIVEPESQDCKNQSYNQTVNVCCQSHFKDVQRNSLFLLCKSSAT